MVDQGIVIVWPGHSPQKVPRKRNHKGANPNARETVVQQKEEPVLWHSCESVASVHLAGM